MKYEILRFNGVSVNDYKYGGILDATFTLHRGETLLLAGLFNSGVKTLINLLCGADNHFEGQIYSNGKKISFITFESMLHSKIAVIGNRSLTFDNILFRDNLHLIIKQKSIFTMIEKQQFSENVLALIDILDINLKTEYVEDLTDFEKIKFDILKAYLAGSQLMVFTDLSGHCNETELAKIVESVEFLKQNKVATMLEIARDDISVFNDISDRCIVFRNGITAASLYKNEQGLFDKENLRHLIVGGPFAVKERMLLAATTPTDVAENANAITIKSKTTQKVLTVPSAKIIGVYDENSRIPSSIEAFIDTINEMLEIRIDEKLIFIKKPIDLAKNRIAVIHNETIERLVFYNLSPVENVYMYAQRIFGKKHIYDCNTAAYIFDKVISRHKILRDCALLKNCNDCHNLSYSRLFDLMIAKWLAINPNIVVMFLPLYNVDIKNTERFRGLCNELAVLGKTVFLISADYDRLQKDCSQIFEI